MEDQLTFSSGSTMMFASHIGGCCDCLSASTREFSVFKWCLIDSWVGYNGLYAQQDSRHFLRNYNLV